MKANLCWNCGRLVECQKVFPNGRPKRRSECAEYIDAPPEPKRVTHKEMAVALGWSVRKIENLVSSADGRKYLLKALERKGVILTYERDRKRIYFYKKEEYENGR